MPSDMQRKAVTKGWHFLIDAMQSVDAQAWRLFEYAPLITEDMEITDPRLQEATAAGALMMWHAETNTNFAGMLMMAGFVPIDALYEGHNAYTPLESAHIQLGAMERQGIGERFGDTWQRVTQLHKLLTTANTAAGGATPVAPERFDTYPNPLNWAMLRAETPGQYGMVFLTVQQANIFARHAREEGFSGRPSSGRLTKDGAAFHLASEDHHSRLRGLRLDAAWCDRRVSSKVRDMLLAAVIVRD